MELLKEPARAAKRVTLRDVERPRVPWTWPRDAGPRRRIASIARDAIGPNQRSSSLVGRQPGHIRPGDNACALVSAHREPLVPSDGRLVSRCRAHTERGLLATRRTGQRFPRAVARAPLEPSLELCTCGLLTLPLCRRRTCCYLHAPEQSRFSPTIPRGTIEASPDPTLMRTAPVSSTAYSSVAFLVAQPFLRSSTIAKVS